MSQQLNAPMGVPKSLKLQYPMPVATFETYAEAQKAVDTLADRQFPVENLAIVGTDLRQYERVLGRKSWGSVLLSGAVSGLMTGLMISLVITLLGLTTDIVSALMMGLALGVLFGVISAALAHALSRGERDFNSITQTFATQYEVMAEHKVAADARQVLGSTGLASGAFGMEPAVVPTEPTQVSTQPGFPPAQQPYGQAQPAEQQPPVQPTGSTAAPDGYPQPYGSDTTFDPRPPAERP